MTYDDLVSIYFVTPPEGFPAFSLPTSAARRLRDALEPIATQGWWSRAVAERLSALGLDFFEAYVWGRAASLGKPAAAAVVATFGVFDPALLTAVYERGSATASREAVLAAREQGAAEALGAIVSADKASALADRLQPALEALDGMGRPLFSALRALPIPDTPFGRLWRSAELVREHRGDGHLAALVASGIDMVSANILTELWLGYRLGEYSSSRGIDSDHLMPAVARLEARGWMEGGSLTAAGRAAREDLEAATDRSQDALVEALGLGIDDVIADAEAISKAVVAAPSFPADPRKRAAG
ncbi:MAG: hypothetical protein ABJD24_04935 [Acidimicrobiales bacterium]